MPQDISERLKEARKKLNLNQIQIASDLDIQQKSISDIENGKILNIPNTYIYYFYKKGISLEWIYDGKGSILSGEVEAPVQDSKPIEMESLFKEVEQVRQTSVKTVEIPLINKEETVSNYTLYERIIESKEYNIRSLFSYIKSLENNLDYLKNLLSKALQNKP
jgi:transcriptional regulator with XRE-family HTH domain